AAHLALVAPRPLAERVVEHGVDCGTPHAPALAGRSPDAEDRSRCGRELEGSGDLRPLERERAASPRYRPVARDPVVAAIQGRVDHVLEVVLRGDIAVLELLIEVITRPSGRSRGVRRRPRIVAGVDEGVAESVRIAPRADRVA